MNQAQATVTYLYGAHQHDFIYSVTATAPFHQHVSFSYTLIVQYLPIDLNLYLIYKTDSGTTRSAQTLLSQLPDIPNLLREAIIVNFPGSYLTHDNIDVLLTSFRFSTGPGAPVNSTYSSIPNPRPLSWNYNLPGSFLNRFNNLNVTIRNPWIIP
jgi:hypothetical protein